MKIALLHDEELERLEATPDTAGAMEAVDAVQGALTELGHQLDRIPVGLGFDVWSQRLLDAESELVFNLCEGVHGYAEYEPRVAAVVELLGLPMTGSSSESLALGRRKDRVNAMLAAAGLPVASWRLVRPGEPPPEDWDAFPAIVKPAGEDASVGITQESVARDPAELAEALARADAAKLGDLLVQRFLPGRELCVGLVGGETLPISEIDYSDMPAEAWPLLSYSAKWDIGSDEDLGSRPRCPARIRASQRNQAVQLGRAAWALIEGRGYGRVDLRSDDDGQLYVLDVNPNPDLSPSSGLNEMARARGWEYVELIEQILAHATSGKAA